MSAVTENPQKMVLIKDTLDILRCLRVWPGDSNKIKFYTVMVVIIFIGPALVAYFLAYYIYLYFVDGNQFDFAEMAHPVSAILAVVITHTYLFLHLISQKKYAAILEDIGDFTDYEKPRSTEYFNEKIKIATYLLQGWIFFSCFSIWTWYAMTECDEDAPYSCGIIVAAATPFVNSKKVPFKTILMTHQISTAFWVASFSFFYGWIVLMIAMILVTRLKHLKEMLLMIPTMVRVERRQHLKKCVQYHQNIIEISDRLYNASYNFLFMHVPACTLMISLIALQLMLTFDYSQFAHGILWFCNISITCFLGEVLRNQSSRISNVAYLSMPWDGDLRSQKDLMLMMIRANKEMVIPGGLMGVCSNEQFTNLIGRMYSFVTLVNQTLMAKDK